MIDRGTDSAGPAPSPPPLTENRSTAVTVVKFGGAVITQKRGDARIRPKVLDRLARELVSVDAPVVLLHGAGSFGHPAAKRFGLAGPPTASQRPAARARGAAIVSSEVRRLHTLVLRAVLDAGGRPWSVPPATVARQSAGRLIRFDPQTVREALSRALIPVLFGDVVVDDEWGFSILSADTIAVELARDLRARRVLFVSDVEGVYGNPVDGRRPVLPSITPAVVATLSERTRGPDVTGGILGKARAMISIAENGCDAGLISGLTDGALSRALRGEPVYGSWSTAGSR